MRPHPLAALARLARRALPILGLAVLAPACSGDDVGSQDEDITDIAHTPVRDQSIGNCWLYASVGWVESLHLRGTNEALNLSESYLTYWHWYDQIVQPSFAELQDGGWFRTAVDLMTRYGLMDEASFLPDEAAEERSARQESARANLNAALAPRSQNPGNPFAGRLSSKTKRTPGNVRRVLDEAFGLAPDVVADMSTAFGPGAPVAINSRASVPARFRRTIDLDVALKEAGKEPRVAKLAEVAPRWVEVSTWQASERALYRRVQRSLHDGQPALVVWNVDFESLDKTAGGFPLMQPGATIDGAHMTVFEDYQARHVPNYGTLEAGVLVTDPAALDHALAEQTEIEFFRIKNSWGTGYTGDPSKTGELPGYVDLYASYLSSPDASAPRGLISVIVPADYGDEAPSISDGCAAGGATACDPSGTRALACGGGMTESSQACEASCDPGSGTCVAAPQGETSCSDFADQDGDGLYDCQDPSSCKGGPECQPGDGAVGTACSQNTECAAEGGDPFCIAEHFGYPGGYCSQFCAGDAECGPQGACLNMGAEGVNLCFQTCDPANPCRDGYTCYTEATWDISICLL